LPFHDRQYAGFVLPFLFGISSAYAQTTPDAGALRQQIEKQLPKVEMGDAKPLTALPPEYKPAPGLSVTVKEFRLAGNTLVSTEQLTPAITPFLNRPLDFSGLQQAAAAVGEAYRAAGWLVRVYLPGQEIDDGIVTLQIVEGIFGKLLFDGSPPERLAAGWAEATIAAAQSKGQPLNAAALDRAMLLLDDLPGVAVAGNLAPGSGQSETDLVLKFADEPLLTGEAGLDNTGSRSTGRERLTANAYLNSPLKRGDQLSANLVHTEGSDYARIAYAAPVGHDGLRLGFNASRLDYRVITPEFKAANIQGNSTTVGLDAQYPLIRSRTHNLYLSTAFDDKNFDNEANNATSTKYRVRNVTVGLMGNLFDKWGGGGANMASLNLSAGDLDLDGSPNQAADATTTGSHGSFTKLRYALSRQQALTTDFSLYALLTGQAASKNLDSSEKFYLGGSAGVRAYPSNEGGGSEGTLLNLELRWRALPNLVVTGFYDWGSVMVNKNNNFTGAPALNRFEIDGAGVSVAWTGPLGLALKGTYARRFGNNPSRDATTGNDQDGTFTRDRIWLTASLPF
jgi:hemolysin activation/secretion protein